MMMKLRDSLVEARPQHCRPSSVEEVRQFMWLPDKHTEIAKGHSHA
jgi:hypothetical protein